MTKYLAAFVAGGLGALLVIGFSAYVVDMLNTPSKYRNLEVLCLMLIGGLVAILWRYAQS
jgi:hypothetical protein